MRGWVKIHRKLLGSQYGKNLEMVGFWTCLLLRANHSDAYCNDGVLIKKGSFKTGRKQLADDLRLSESKVERFLKKLEIAQQIEQQKTTKYRIISITNWDEYQKNEQEIEQQADNKRTTSGQQADTNKNDKKDKNEKKKGRAEPDQFVVDVVDYLNKTADRDYKPTTVETIKLINARKKEGYSLEDFTSVIDLQTKLWKDNPNMKMYLAPKTLFNQSNFEKYLQNYKASLGDIKKEQELEAFIAECAKRGTID